MALSYIQNNEISIVITALLIAGTKQYVLLKLDKYSFNGTTIIPFRDVGDKNNAITIVLMALSYIQNNGISIVLTALRIVETKQYVLLSLRITSACLQASHI